MVQMVMRVRFMIMRAKRMRVTERMAAGQGLEKVSVSTA